MMCIHLLKSSKTKHVTVISFRMYLNLCNAKFSIIESDVENRVYGEVILSLHSSIAFFNMYNRVLKVNKWDKWW